MVHRDLEQSKDEKRPYYQEIGVDVETIQRALLLVLNSLESTFCSVECMVPSSKYFFVFIIFFYCAIDAVSFVAAAATTTTTTAQRPSFVCYPTHFTIVLYFSSKE